MTEIDQLVDRALSVVTTLARRGSTVTTGVAIFAGLVVGSAYLVGLAAFGGGTRSVWAVIGAFMLLLAVGAPLLASFRLRAIPRKAPRLAAELRAILAGDGEAKRVVIETVEADSGTAQPTVVGFGATRSPMVLGQYQRFTTLRGVASSEGVANLAAVAQRLASLPGLIAIALLVTMLSAVLGFVFLLIWIF
jgi:hypothetical protein